MLCVASLLVLSILSIFSAKYRSLTKEAFDCVARRVTLRPCTTGFDVKVKSTILSSLLMKSPALAKFVSKRFDVISALFIISFIGSLVWSGRGIYLYWSTGSCNGLNQGGFCVLDPSGKSNAISTTGVECRAGGGATGDLTLDAVNLNHFPLIKGNTNKTLTFIGCYSCPYTKKTYPIIKDLINTYKPNVRFVFYPVHKDAEYLMPYDYVLASQYTDRYAEWVDRMYSLPIEEISKEDSVLQIIKSMGIDSDKVKAAVADPTTKTAVQKLKYEIDKTGIYGTPTIFLGNKPVVGPKPYRVYRQMLNNSLF